MIGFFEYLQTGEDIPEGLSSHGIGAGFIIGFLFDIIRGKILNLRLCYGCLNG